MKKRRTLKPYGRFDWLWRSCFTIEHAESTWALDVDFFDSWGRVYLYRDGLEYDRGVANGWTGNKKVTFDLGDATLHVQTSLYGMRQADLEVDGQLHQMRPVDGSAEAWRGNLERNHPLLHRILDITSWTILVIALINLTPTLVNFGIDRWGWGITPIFSLPPALDTALTIAGILAGIDRALRFKYKWWLDG